jgi:hypothetical protein
MTSDEKTILKDLSHELNRKINVAIMHYVEMCNAAEIPARSAAEAAMKVFLEAGACTVVANNTISQELFAQSAFNIYAERLADYQNHKQGAAK